MTTIQEQINADGVRFAETNIQTEEWLQMLNDGVIGQRQIEVLLCFYREPEHQGICKVLAKKYGGTMNNFSNPIWRMGQAVQQYLNRFEVKGLTDKGESTEENVYWVIPMNGKDSKQGFVWTVKPELCKALESYLYQGLLDCYKNRRKTIDLIEDDELYKWQMVDSCAGKNGVDLIRAIVDHPHNNLMDWRQKDDFRKMASQKPQELSNLLEHLFDETIERKDRVQSFLSHDASERSLSVFLCCQYPNTYMPYKESYYVALCEYLGIKKCTKVGEKYLHYMEIMAPLVAIVKEDEALHKLLSKDIEKYPSNDLLIAQDIVYTIFERHLINPKKMKDIFEWIPFYKELAQKLLEYKDNPSKLASVIYENFDRDKEIKFLHDGDGSDFNEIDPFTVFSIINRVMNNRVDMIKKMRELFDISAKAPDSFDGIPTQNPMNASFCSFSENRSEDGKDIERLWNLFEKALQGEEDMEQDFNDVLKQMSIAVPKLTMGLFYVNPYNYLSLDGNNRRYLEDYGVSTKNYQKMKYADYIDLLEQVKYKMEKKEIAEQSFPEFSANAYSGDGMSDDDGTDESYYQEIAELLRFKKNIIIEGAPGVGKTYELPRIITRLCFPELGSIPKAVLSNKFQQLKDNHQVEYVTFHQSMDYEEFVEGIRPQTNDDGNVIYKTEDGIFKQMCEEAMKPIVEENKLKIRGDATVWKVSLAGTGDNPVRSDCMKNGHIRIGWDYLGEDLSQVQEPRYEGKVILDAFYDKMNIGDIVFSCYSARSIDAIGVVTGEAEWHDEYKDYKRLRKVEWLLKGVNEDIYELNGQTSMTLGTVYRLNNITLDKVFGILNSYGVSNPTEAKKNNRPYVLVIDEINRGNVSKIFGELITLIEPDKRAGKASEITVKLPYSKKPFVVPDNLYIIGTMNTADRSLDTLDYAMRRRFAFVKFKPTVIDVDGFNEELFAMVSKLFISNYDEYCENADAILQPSEYLADEIQPSDVWIGHSYFLMYDEEGIDRTQLRIQYEIIPILEEYIKDGVFKDINEVKNVIEALISYTDATSDN